MDTVRIARLLVVLSNTFLAAEKVLKGGDFCDFDAFSASCSAADEVVVMETALYGRMQFGRCVVSDLGYMGCHADVLHLADRVCSGRRSCTVPIPDQKMTKEQPCLPELKTYLHAQYYCQKVISVEPSQCARCDFVKVTEPAGYISSAVTRESGCGTPSCPWLIEVLPGQRLNITLVNFAWSPPGSAQRSSPHRSLGGGCQVYATLKEATADRSTTVCGEGDRLRHVYLSVTSSVELRIVGSTAGEDNNLEHFLFKYEAVGCVDPDPPLGGWARRVGDQVTMGCNASTTDTWKLTCSGYQWQGERRDCGIEPSSKMLGVLEGQVVSLPYGLSVAVIVIVAFIIGILILIAGLFIVRRRKAASGRQNGQLFPPPPPHPPSYKESISAEYTGDSRTRHIWQRPLPKEPISTPSGHPGDYMQRPGSIHYGYNTITTVKQESGLPGVKFQSSGGHSAPQGSSSGDSLPLEYGNNTIARRECESDSEDHRYFQLDSDPMG